MGTEVGLFVIVVLGLILVPLIVGKFIKQGGS